MGIYDDIARRTGGNIYIGVTGPVRTGKSTFVKRVMEQLVLPNMKDEYARQRAIDELPQSGSGKTIMTAEPKFVPEEAVEICPDETSRFRVRMIDSVGFMVPGAVGAEEDGQPRLVTTPWFDHEIPMTEAAELGTKKVMEDHCTAGLVITTDGSFTELERESYLEAESNAVRAMQATGKPFLVLVNSENPKSAAATELVQEISRRHNVQAMAVNCLSLDQQELTNILKTLLMAFPMTSMACYFPGYLQALDPEHPIKKKLYEALSCAAEKIQTLSQAGKAVASLTELNQVSAATVTDIDLGTGAVTCRLEAPEGLFYQILSEQSGLELREDADLLSTLQKFREMRKNYDHIAAAMDQVRSTGYGIVMPVMEDLKLQTPELIKKGGAYGVRLRASAPSIHLMRADVTTELSPMVGSEQQSQELVSHLLDAYEGDNQVLFDNSIFGKSLYEMISDGLSAKIQSLPDTSRLKLKDALTRIVNEGGNGLICLIV